MSARCKWDEFYIDWETGPCGYCARAEGKAGESNLTKQEDFDMLDRFFDEGHSCGNECSFWEEDDGPDPLY